MNDPRQTFRLLGATWILTASAATPATALDMPAFEPPVPVAADATSEISGWSDRDPTIATDGSGTWVIAWQSKNSLFGTIGGDSDILFARSTDHGLTFTPQQALNTNAATDYTNGVHGDHDESPALATDGNGRWFAVWSRSVYTLGARSEDGGDTWSSPMHVVRGEDPSVATDGNGVWITVAEDSEGYRHRNILFSRSSDNAATWSFPVLIDPTAVDRDDFATSARIYFSGGVWIATWTRADTWETTDVYYSRSLDGGLTWSAPASIRSPPDGLIAMDAKLASNGSGTWVAVWTARDGVDHGPIRSARSTDGGSTWGPSQQIGSGDGTERTASISVGPADTFMAVWSRYGSVSTGVDSDVLGAISDDGGLTWSVPAAINSTAATDSIAQYTADEDFTPVVGYDPSGSWLTAWMSNNNFDGAAGTDHQFETVMAMTGLDCGNGVVDVGEECDDAVGRRDGDCCNRGCSFDSDTTWCTPDADLCTADQCDGAGTCEHLDVARSGCLAPDPQGASLRVSSDLLRWQWEGHDPGTESRFGSPDCLDDYAVCVYDDLSGLVGRADAPGSNRCFSVPTDERWKRRYEKFSFKDPAASDGVSRMSLRPVEDTEAALKVRAEGLNFTSPPLPITSFPIRVQLVNSDERCWDSTFSSGRTRSSGFRATSD